MDKTVNILNRKARFEYDIEATYTAGLVLHGTEIKSIREGKANIAEGFCEFSNGELFLINAHIDEYRYGTHFNHKPKSERKLLLQRKELRKLERQVEQKGMTIIPLKLFISEKGWAKIDIGLARGRKSFDKREHLKDRDVQRDLDRVKNRF